MRWPTRGVLLHEPMVPWRATWRYRVCACVLSAAWALCLGVVVGCALFDLPFWRAPAGAAAAGLLARVLLEVEARMAYEGRSLASARPTN